MSAELEGILYFGASGLVMVIAVVFATIRMNKTRNFKNTVIEANAVSFGLYIVISLWWWLQASDGFSQVFGVLIYGASFVISILINTGLLFFLKKKACF